MRDELKEGDQIMVKVLALEGNKIKLSRKAILREQREKLRRAAAGQSPTAAKARRPVRKKDRKLSLFPTAARVPIVEIAEIGAATGPGATGVLSSSSSAVRADSLRPLLSC